MFSQATQYPIYFFLLQNDLCLNLVPIISIPAQPPFFSFPLDHCLLSCSNNFRVIFIAISREAWKTSWWKKTSPLSSGKLLFPPKLELFRQFCHSNIMHLIIHECKFCTIFFQKTKKMIDRLLACLIARSLVWLLARLIDWLMVMQRQLQIFSKKSANLCS